VADPSPADVPREGALHTDFVRVDLYRVGGRVVFGELTSFPAGGDGHFDPECFDREFGRLWRVPKRYR
jgi:teichuronopeptide biosynthesis TupA-like protein